MGKKLQTRTIALCILFAIMAAGLFAAFAKSGNLAEAARQAGLSPGADGVEAVSELTGSVLRLLAVLVPISAVALAFITREVVSALCVSLFYGYLMLGAVGAADGFSGPIGYLAGTLSGSASGVIATATDPDSATVVVMCLVLGGLVAVINRTGAFRSLAVYMTRRIKNPRQAALVGEALGVAVFFDDYANSLIVGPVMRPVTDSMGISREKLAYIVDSTAAPVSSIAIISSWVGTEVAAIRVGLEAAEVNASAYGIFLAGIPYNFYNILTLAFVFICAISGREYGPMLRAETRARAGQPLRPGSVWKDQTEPPKSDGEKPARISVALLPIAVLCILAFIGFYVNGCNNAILAGLLEPGAAFSLEKLAIAFGNADTIFIILEASVVASVLAIILGVFSKSFSFTEGLLAWQDGASGLLVTVMILVLAWSLSDVISKLGLVSFLVELITMHVAYWLVPSLIFITCCLISFGIGSYGCMAIVVPMVVPIAYGVVARTSLISDGWQFVVACVACVLSGSVFGDHCSPITDTTILSSIGAGCDNIDHAKTQLPYAITTAVIATVSGTLLAGMGISFWVSYPIAIAMIIGVFMMYGHRPEAGFTGHDYERSAKR